MSISDVAIMCGFNSHAHLSKYFHNIVRMTPKDYRRSWRYYNDFSICLIE
ncbi:AraC family transcriptional regulator [Pleurocapsales cyanobacterium LEGE 10410]|nr:AraC family transcriptional regulator [Pleurocapsales cyanobacterium LEGE 10410]